MTLLLFKKDRKSRKLNIARLAPKRLENYVSCSSVRFFEIPFLLSMRCNLHRRQHQQNMLPSCWLCSGDDSSLKHREERHELMKSSPK